MYRKQWSLYRYRYFDILDLQNPSIRKNHTCSDLWWKSACIITLIPVRKTDYLKNVKEGEKSRHYIPKDGHRLSKQLALAFSIPKTSAAFQAYPFPWYSCFTNRLPPETVLQYSKLNHSVYNILRHLPIPASAGYRSIFAISHSLILYNGTLWSRMVMI